MTDYGALMEEATQIAAELNAIKESETPDPDEVESVKNRVHDLGSDLEEAWEEAYNLAEAELEEG